MRVGIQWRQIWGVDDEFSDDTDESDPEYKRSSETEESEDESFVPDEYGSDNEMNAIRENCKKFKQGLVDSMNIPDENVGEESEYDSENEILGSLSSSSEDENAKIGYVGPPNPKKKVLGGRRIGLWRFQVGKLVRNL